ncbi:MAG: KpsF/GutQ family sugar-phosphate isomerase [Verrucomicrobia bacterium]|nr:MAG: KpsF/GutQ family sugar-phosphate isomerase [Verrucomicrobiota bacterium]
MNYVNKAREVIDIELAGLQRLRESLDGGFSKAVDLILEGLRKRGKILVTGVGKNAPIGQKIAATLTSTGCPAVFLHPSDAMHGDLGLMAPNDVVLALSYSGASEELQNLILVIKRQKVPIIAITGEPDSALGRDADVVINVAVEREAGAFNLAPTTSTTVTLVVGDALAMVLLEARGFKREDYAKLHPGGAIGRTLLLRVADIMRTGERLAKVRSDQRVRDAVLAMTSARAGAVAVVDANDIVLGIFTDGDLRRHLNDGPPLADMTVEQVMTAQPITVRQNDLAVDVLAIYEKQNIDDLVVVDERGRLAGMVDIQDLPKFKIF